MPAAHSAAARRPRPSGPTPRDSTGTLCSWNTESGGWYNSSGELHIVKKHPKRTRERAANRAAKRANTAASCAAAAAARASEHCAAAASIVQPAGLSPPLAAHPEPRPERYEGVCGCGEIVTVRLYAGLHVLMPCHRSTCTTPNPGDALPGHRSTLLNALEISIERDAQLERERAQNLPRLAAAQQHSGRLQHRGQGLAAGGGAFLE